MQSDNAGWLPDLANRGKPVYLAIADAIADDIRSGRLAAGQRLPPQRALADRLGLDLTTVSRAYSEARQRGLLDARVGQGTFIRLPDSGGGGAADRRDDPPPAFDPVPTGTPLINLTIDMTMNQPPLPKQPDLLARMRHGLVGAVQQFDPQALLRYPDSGASVADQAAGGRWLARRLPELAAGTPDGAGDGGRVVVCPGSQSALLALLCLLTEPGDTVCTEALTYPGFKALARQLGLRLVGVPMDAQGLDPDRLRAVFDATAPKLLYCTPTLHNPTTATLPPDRRRAIAELARARGVPVIEDDIYGVLPPAAPAPIATLAPDMTYYLAGLSKCVAPGLRIAYVAAPDRRQAVRLAASLRATTLGTPPVTAAIAGQWLRDGTAEALLAAIRGEAMLRQHLARATLPAAAVAADPHGFHLWLTLPATWSRGEFAGHLRGQGIIAAVSDAFAVTGPAPEALRLCLGAPVSAAACQHMLNVVAAAWEQPPGLAGIVI